MAERTSIVNISGDYEETKLQLAKHLGTNILRRKVFNTIYGRAKVPRSKKQIIEAAGISTKDAQQVQNALDHLHKHHLIVQRENGGAVKDRSFYLYGKDPTVRANRAEIIRLADDPKARDQVATKRRPIVRGLSGLKVVTVKTLRKQKHLHVLYLTADTDDAHRLRVDAEVRHVQNAVRGSRYRQNITLEFRPAANLQTIIDGLNDHRPRIVHFSGHGNSGGIAVDDLSGARRHDRAVSFALLARALAATDSPPDIVVLNSCESAGARRAFLPPARVLIVMGDSIGDLGATNFAVQFYAAIAAGQSIKAAFDQAIVAIASSSITEVNTPKLLLARGVDPAKLILT
ncbi:MAG: CHAT domain-containing protein [Hyphomicrobiales bacterium]|nr:CHAT domain-containing protein [Hyphomicrobiales bacterium]